MFILVTTTSLALSTGFGLSPGSCLLPHIGGGPDVYEHDEFSGSRSRGNPHAALLQAPVRKMPEVPSRRQHLLAAAAAVCAVPAAGVVAEAMVLLTLADAFAEKFGGDSADEMARNVRGYLDNLAIR